MRAPTGSVPDALSSGLEVAALTRAWAAGHALMPTRALSDLTLVSGL